jgi:hypothetical protein
MPTHYAFKTPDRTARIVREYEELRTRGTGPQDRTQAKTPGRPGPPSEDQVKAVIAALDDQGRWLSTGNVRPRNPDSVPEKMISTALFVRNVGVLTRYLGATRP